MSTRPVFPAVVFQIDTHKWQTYYNPNGVLTTLGNECDTSKEAAESALSAFYLLTAGKQYLTFEWLPRNDLH